MGGLWACPWAWVAQGSLLYLVSSTILTNCRKLILFCTSCFPLIMGQRTGWVWEESNLLREKWLQGWQSNKHNNKRITTVGEMLWVINHPLALCLLAGSWLLAGWPQRKVWCPATLHRNVWLDSGTYTYVRATSTYLIKQTNTQAIYLFS